MSNLNKHLNCHKYIRWGYFMGTSKRAVNHDWVGILLSLASIWKYVYKNFNPTDRGRFRKRRFQKNVKSLSRKSYSEIKIFLSPQKKNGVAESNWFFFIYLIILKYEISEKKIIFWSDSFRQVGTSKLNYPAVARYNLKFVFTFATHLRSVMERDSNLWQASVMGPGREEFQKPSEAFQV